MQLSKLVQSLVGMGLITAATASQAVLVEVLPGDIATSPVLEQW